MMRKNLPFLFAPALMILLLAGCSSNMTSSTIVPPPASVPVSITMTDDPPAGVSVLFFQVSLTDATLTPATGSPVPLLGNNTPIQIDVTQLQALSAFLSTADVAAGTYNSLSLTFASPQLVIFNQSDTAIASTCAVGSVCQLTPTVEQRFLSADLYYVPLPGDGQCRLAVGIPHRFPSQHCHPIRSLRESGRDQRRHDLRASSGSGRAQVRFPHRHGRDGDRKQ